MMRTLFRISAFICISALLVINGGCSSTGNVGQSLSYNLGMTPESIDPALNTSIAGANVILANFQGLMKLDQDNKGVPGIAASYTKDSDVKYTFRLREAKWSDGRMVTAEDFEYAWKRVLNPETGSKYAYQLYYIKNGEAYNKKMASAQDVGINVVDSKTLEVTLESPTDYFLELLALPVYMPLREDIVKKNPDSWADNPATYIGNGPFKMVSYKKGDYMELVKNDNYHDAGRTKLDRVVFRMMEGPGSYLAAWEKGELDIIESPPSSKISELKSQNKLIIQPYLGTYFLALNNNVKPLDDRRIRKALSYALDRIYIIQEVLKNEAFPATALVSKGIPDADISRDFRDVGGSYFKGSEQVAEAQRLLTEGGYPEGKNFPKITMAYDDTGYHKDIALAVQEMWKRNLGIDIGLEEMSRESLIRNRAEGSYHIARQGWIADFTDPIAFLDLFVGARGNNETGYSNQAYDELIARAKGQRDQQKRMEYLHDAENLLMEDMPIIPVFFYTNLVLMKPYVKGIVKSPLGFVYFDQGYIENK